MPGISPADIERLEGKFGADHVYIKGRQRRHFDDEIGENRHRNHRDNGNWRRPSTPPPTPVTSIRTTSQVAKPAVAEPLPAKIEKKEATVMNTQPQRESCPVCGNPKDQERKMTDGHTSKILVCIGCSGTYKAYVDEATKAIVANPTTAPEPMDKFSWVLSKIDLGRFQKEAEEAIKSYRNKYDVTVTAVLVGRNYLDGKADEKAVWGEMATLLRPRMQLSATHSAAPAVRSQLEATVNNEYRTMCRLAGRLESATRLVPELREKLAAKAAEAVEFAAAAKAIEDVDAAKAAATAKVQTEAPAPAKVAKAPRKRVAKDTAVAVAQ